MSKATGRRYEREVIELLESRGWDVLDVSPNAGTYSRHQCDLLVLPPHLEPEDHGEDEYLVAEVKYRKKASGLKALYRRHIDSIGLGTVEHISWSGAHGTGGVAALEAFADGVDERWETEDGLVGEFKTLEEWFHPTIDGEAGPPRDVIFFRGSSRFVPTGKWIACWRTDYLRRLEG